MTHEHTDHVSALRVLLKKHNNIKICASQGTLDCLKDKEIINNTQNFQVVNSKKRNFAINYRLIAWNFVIKLLNIYGNL